MVKIYLLTASFLPLLCCASHESDVVQLAHEAGRQAIAMGFEEARDTEIFIRSYTYHNLSHRYAFQLRLIWSDANGSAYWMDGLLHADDKGQMLTWQEQSASRNLLEYRRFLQ